MLTGQRFLVHQWTDGFAVFDRDTGDTHALDPLSYAAFVAASGADDALAAVSVSLRTMHPELADDERELMARDCLERLVSYGLIRPGKSN